jgi:hypothetical protein
MTMPGERDVVPLDRNATYSVNRKALRRWADERLTLERHEDGSIAALFRYEGSTCSNMGQALHFNYSVTLGPRAARYPVLEQRCEPALGDMGYAAMCRYRIAPEQLMEAIDEERPLLGQPLDDVLAWERPPMGAACYCEAESRDHKWGLVLETIHFVLVQQEQQPHDAGIPHPTHAR